MNLHHIDRILVPVDLSETSLNALETGASLAVRNNALLQITYVDEQLPGALTPDNFSNATTHTPDVLSALAGAIQHKREIQLEILHEEGNVIETIIRTSIQQQSGVIVMGSHGASGYREGFIGSNTYGVMKHSSCPVLMVPLKSPPSFNKVLYPIRPVTGALVRYPVVSFFTTPEASIHVLGLSYRNIEMESKKVLEKIVEEVRVNPEVGRMRTKVAWGQGTALADDVLQYSQNLGPDLIVVTPILDVIDKPNYIGPHTQKILNGAKVPVLSIKKVGVPVLA